MTKLIGLKELQTNTRGVREAVEQGIDFIVIYRSRPIFEIKPILKKIKFTKELEGTGLYTNEFIERMNESEQDIEKGKVKTYTAKKFLKSLL